MTNSHKAGFEGKAVIFDLDGTLLDTLADIAYSVNTALAARGLPVHPVDAYRHFVGDGWKMLITRALPEQERTGALIAQCGAQAMEIYRQNWNCRTRPYDGILEMLEELRLKGAPLAILSNKPHAETVRCIDTYFSAVPFAEVLGQRDGFPAKPDPTSALEIARKMNLTPESVLFVGDSAVDMKTANAAGMPAVGAAWGFRGPQELLDAGCRSIVNHPREILSLLE